MANVPSLGGPSTCHGHSTLPEEGNTHCHAPPGPSNSNSAATRPDTFLCTFCWRPQRCDTTNPSSAPIVVGSRARLACEPCYNALLDLAVCWVCGEVVFRGNECVSLGWCFWHRGCYGCLLCGNRRVVEGVKVEELFGDTALGGPVHSADLGRNKGREIDEIPLCGKCAEEVSQVSTKDDHLIPMALRRIDRYDGGLSRRRWEEAMRRSSHEGHERHETASSLGPQSELEHQEITFTNSKERPRMRTPSPIYVPIHDPFGGPAFRPSQTKPIPKWMQYLPRKRSDDWDYIGRPSSVLDDYFSPHDSSVAESDMASGSRRSPPPPPVPAHIIPVTSAESETREEQDTSTDEVMISKRNSSPPRLSPALVSEPTRPSPPFKPIQMSRPFTFIDEKPGQRPSSRFHPGRLSPKRHVRFISPPKTTSNPTIASGLVSHIKSPSESSEYLDRHASQASQGRYPMLFPSGLRDMSLSVANPVVKRHAGSAAGPSAKTILRSFGDQSRSTDLARGSADTELTGPSGKNTRHHGLTAQSKPHGGGDGAVDSGGDRRPGRVMTFQDQLKRVFGFS